jgi:hypothetical protein
MKKKMNLKVLGVFMIQIRYPNHAWTLVQLIDSLAIILQIDVAHFKCCSNFINAFEPSLVQFLYQYVLDLD